ncbi:SusD family protein [Sphingobacterium nematocida]|uniref:SusD family protein n=1 Tax=Sphingobacterium nematocida TaxID=1513896 RepID=A0A1T5B0Q7_9SPHI|nr:RagB/SusD family nutrient uptake outer membrane protein [Sphingobacterium nematocida]SKB40550.1 SusD family protein [Sphingobacterium nematocida]
MNSIIKNISLICSCIVGIFLMLSCSDFLDAKQNYSQSDGTQLSDLQAILDDAEYMNKRSASLPEAASDDYFLPENNYSKLTQVGKEAYRWELRNYTFPNDWANLYLQVYNANLCLEGLDKIVDKKTDIGIRNRIYGSAHFYRGYAYLALVTTFCKAYREEEASNDLGIVLREISDFNVNTSRSNLKASYKKIIDDLNIAVAYLSNRVEIPLRPSKAAAYAALARTYLSMRNYHRAELYADSALMLHSEVMDFNDPNLKLGSNLPFANKYNPEVVFYSAVGTYSISTAHPMYARIEKELYESYEANDLRKQAYFLPLADGYRFKGMYSENTNFCFTGITTAELLFIKAECRARDKDIKATTDAIKLILQKRYKNGVYNLTQGLNQDNVLSWVLQERRKELLMRGIRYSDLKRLNVEGAEIKLSRFVGGIQYSLLPNDARYAQPLPVDAVRLGGLEQNPY